ncbi:hypothetical protein BKA70DRAFT_1489793 [Coprinopsis sp. MPI-PUGE-AT-0042]|nr:hypothetical protein BKA70DRAFT_1489793 [Coprinopsis sp. MPI-PUGE-AT-0042]
MPHKKAKRSTRVQDRSQQGTDWAPGKESIANEPLPKSAHRILNAVKIQQEFKANKRKRQDEDERKGAAAKRKKLEKTSLKIMPGESMQHFNRRVEDDLRPMVKSAMESGRSVSRKATREELERKQAAKKLKPQRSGSPSDELLSNPRASEPKAAAKQQNADRPVRDFVGRTTMASAPKRLNDVALAPPEFKKLPRGGHKLGTGASSKSDGVLSMAQKAMMEQEREKAIARYRELKAMRKQPTESLQPGAN